MQLSQIMNGIALANTAMVINAEAKRADRALNARDDALQAAHISRNEADALSRTASLAHRRALVAEAEIARLREELMIMRATKDELLGHCSSLLEELQDIRGH